MLHQQHYWKFASTERYVGHHSSVNWDVEMQRLANFETQWLYYKIEMCAAEWVVMGVDCGWGVCKCRTSALLKLAVTLLQMSHRAACSNTQHCLKQPACYCTSVSTGLLDMTDLQVIIIVVNGGYTGFLLDEEPRCGFDSRWFHWKFSLPTPSSRTMALGSTWRITEISTRNISWGKGGRCVSLTILPLFCA